jgi:uncharacterized membrane protein YkoI
MRTLSIIIAGCGLFGLQLGAAEKKIKIQDLPPAVQQTVKEQTRNATLVGVTKEVENGKTQYELETKANGKTRDLMIDDSGAIVSVEQEVTLDSIPAAAKVAIEKKAAGGKITKVETVTKGATVTYEAALQKGSKKSEVTVAADGSEVK